MPGPRRSLWERFWSKVEVDPVTHCWLWRGGVGQRRGRGEDGRLRRGGRSDGFVSPHRLVVEWAQGAPPFAGAVAAHLCDEELCCNPAHIHWRSQSENLLARPFESADAH